MAPRPGKRRLAKPNSILAFSSFGRSLVLSNRSWHHKHPTSCSKKTHATFPGGISVEHVDNKRASGIESPIPDEGDQEDIVHADFVFFDPKPEDFHGAKILLQTYLDVTEWDLSGFVDLILAQTTVGTVVKIEDDDDNVLFSLVTAINLERYKSHQCIAELKEFLLKVCHKKDVRSKLQLLLGEKARDVGLLVSQRVVNLPLELLPPLYDALFDEVSWATEDEPTQELQDSFRFKYYLLVTRIYKRKNADQQKEISKSYSDESVIYIKPEDEIFRKFSLWSFAFPLHTQQVVTHEPRNYRLNGLVMAVEAGKIPAFRQELKALVSGS